MSEVIRVTQKGKWKKTYGFLRTVKEKRIFDALVPYGEKGVSVLSASTPIDTGESASSWSYEIAISNSEVRMEWHNNRMGNDGKTPVVILIQTGHGTRTGGYVPPNDFINPVMKPLFDEIADAVWRVVESL